MARRRWRGARVKVFHCLLGRLHLFLLSLFSRLPVRAFIRPLRAINERRRSFILSPTSAVDARACAPPAASQARSVLRALPPRLARLRLFFRCRFLLFLLLIRSFSSYTSHSRSASPSEGDEFLRAFRIYTLHTSYVRANDGDMSVRENETRAE